MIFMLSLSLFRYFLFYFGNIVLCLSLLCDCLPHLNVFHLYLLICLFSENLIPCLPLLCWQLTTFTLQTSLLSSDMSLDSIFLLHGCLHYCCGHTPEMTCMCKVTAARHTQHAVYGCNKKKRKEDDSSHAVHRCQYLWFHL